MPTGLESVAKGGARFLPSYGFGGGARLEVKALMVVSRVEIDGIKPRRGG